MFFFSLLFHLPAPLSHCLSTAVPPVALSIFVDLIWFLVVARATRAVVWITLNAFIAIFGSTAESTVV